MTGQLVKPIAKPVAKLTSMERMGQYAATVESDNGLEWSITAGQLRSTSQARAASSQREDNLLVIDLFEPCEITSERCQCIEI